MEIISIILSGLALLVCLITLILLLSERKRTSRRNNALLDFIHNECVSAVYSVDNTTIEEIRKAADTQRELFTSLARTLDERFKQFGERIDDLEKGACPDYEKSLEAARAVNDFSAGITAILGFDPMASVRKERRRDSEEDD